MSTNGILCNKFRFANRPLLLHTCHAYMKNGWCKYLSYQKNQTIQDAIVDILLEWIITNGLTHRPLESRTARSTEICIQILIYKIYSEFTGFPSDSVKFRIPLVPKTEGPIRIVNPVWHSNNDRTIRPCTEKIKPMERENKTYR